MSRRKPSGTAGIRHAADYHPPPRGGWAVGKDGSPAYLETGSVESTQKQRSRGRLCLNDGSWSYDFVSAMNHDGRSLRLLTLIDGYHAGVPGDSRGPAAGQSGGHRDARSCGSPRNIPCALSEYLICHT